MHSKETLSCVHGHRECCAFFEAFTEKGMVFCQDAGRILVQCEQREEALYIMRSLLYFSGHFKLSATPRTFL